MTKRLPASGRRVTIQEVARTAGVSVSAVSKVVREAYGVSPEMRSRVSAAIDELGYRPNTGARSMRGRSYTIGVMLVDFTSPYQPEVAQGVTDELQGTSFTSILISGGSEAGGQQRATEALIDRQVDGLILIAPFCSHTWLEELGASIPVVAVGRHGASTNYDTVSGDDVEGARLVVDHLVGLGHRRIVFTGHPTAGLERPFVLSHIARQDGYEAAMRRHGLEPDVLVTFWSEQGGYVAAGQALDQSSPPTAIFAGADIAALGVLRAAEERGLRVPEDLSVAGYDNIYMSTIGRVSLTTVDQAGPLTGSISARLLLQRINDGRTQPVHYILPPRLEARRTTASPTIGVQHTAGASPRVSVPGAASASDGAGRR
ncbi:MAG: LacI family DNA-binding transcriptional regulator [Mycobacterium sp.]|jgi:LacI family transcriptional regulator